MKDKGNNRIDEGRQIDDLFRQGLENLRPEPSKDLWKGINRKLWWDEISHFTFTNLSKVLLIGGIAGMMTLITALVVVVVPQAKTSGEDPLSIFAEQGSVSTSLVIPVSSLSGQTNVDLIINKHNVQNEKVIPTDNFISLNPLTSADPDEELSTDSYSSSGSAYFSNMPPSSPGKTDEKRNQEFISFMDPISNENILVVNMDNATALLTPAMIQNIAMTNPPVPRFFSIDMGVSPEVTFNGSTASKSNTNFSGDIGFNYTIGRFSVRSGIGISYIADDGIYRIDYKSKDSVGFYNMVVSYAINQQNPSEITYITQQVVVYDSIQHIADDRTRNRYTYLQVPFFAGFRILETNRLGLTLHAGPMVSFMIGKKEAQPVIDYANARIIRIDNNTPVRVKTSWQLWLGLRLDYKISKEFSLFAEPYYKYYFKPVVEQNETQVKSPYSIGLGIGIQYNFGRKTQKK
jgi:hypothetical protein